MFDTNKLRGRIIEKYGTIGAFCDACARSFSFVSQYLNGKANLDQPTIEEWRNLLEIPANEIDAYFFAPRVHETEQTEG